MKNSTGGTSFPLAGILAVLFIALKLTGYIAWSWWWVLAPLWAPLALALVFLLIAGVIYALIGKGRRNRKAARTLLSSNDFYHFN